MVDDEEAVLEILQRILEGLGYRVTATCLPLDAFQSFSANTDSFDLLLTDMTMPGMNGAELVHRIRQIKADLPVVLCTGFSDLLNEQVVKLLGSAEYLMKPVVRSELARVVREMLDKAACAP